MRNILDAIYDIVNNDDIHIGDYSSRHSNVANANGDTLEQYIVDIFAGTYDISNASERQRLISQAFSYKGNKNNPPDLILRGGDAIEVKKVESAFSSIALNSSYPKDKLYSNNPKITQQCRICEQWEEKDIIYIVGEIPSNSRRLTSLAFIYGIDYCASKNIYENILDQISSNIRSIEGIDFIESNELAHINNVDPLNITYFRARGMWGIQSPFKLFQSYYNLNSLRENRFNFMAIISDEKLSTFENVHLIEQMRQCQRFSVQDIIIPTPNNPAISKSAKLLTYYK